MNDGSLWFLVRFFVASVIGRPGVPAFGLAPDDDRIRTTGATREE
ncbi:hypothetical protein ACQUSR_25740 [Streptomyces sp. P1-3]